MADQQTKLATASGQHGWLNLLHIFRGKNKPRWLERGILVLMALFLPLLLISNPRISATDEAQYYVYLTSLRFDGDLDFANDYARLAELNPKAGIDNLLSESRIREKTGLYGNIAPVGSALLWAPFFLAADLAVQTANVFGAGISADGFSKPYIVAVCYGSALYAFAGLLLCYRLARRYASQRAATLATATVWLATPLIFYMIVQMAFAHANGFFLVSLFLWVWQGTRGQGSGGRGQEAAMRGRGVRAWVALGIIGGLMTMTREQLGLFLLLPAIEAVVDYRNIVFRPTTSSSRVSLAAGQFGRHALFLAVFLLTLVPQLLTYQVLNGEPRPASEVGGKFNLCSPHWIDTLIDYDPAPAARCNIVGDPAVDFPRFAHGAFVWAPVLPLALAGLLLLWRRDRFLVAVLLTAFLAQTYLNGAFGTTWHLSGSFGFRRLIECSPIFIPGLALLLDRAMIRVDWRVLALLALVLIAWNFGLVANWTVLQPDLRKGLVWPDVWRWQLEVPVRLVNTLRALLFDRCSLMENGC